MTVGVRSSRRLGATPVLVAALLAGWLAAAGLDALAAEIFETRLPTEVEAPPNRAQLGWSVALAGDGLTVDTLAAGAPVEAGDRGALYLFDRSGIEWQRAGCTRPGPQPCRGSSPGDQLGFAVALAGNRLVAGAPGAANDQGAVVLFQRPAPGAAWMECATLLATGGIPGDRFGEAVSIDAVTGTLIVGAPGADGGRGRAFLFGLAGSGCSAGNLVALSAADRGAGDAIGRAVAVRGGRAAVGAPFDDDTGSESGSVYLFERGASWPTAAEPLYTGGQPFTAAGFAVGLSPNANTLAVGSLGGGSIALLERGAGGSGGEMPPLAVGPASAAAQFGVSLSLGDGLLVAGARLADPRGADSGAAFVFERSNGWQLERALDSPEVAAGDELGIAVATHAGHAAVGAYRTDLAGSQDSGAVYLFERQETTLALTSAASVVAEAAGTTPVGVVLTTDDLLPTRAMEVSVTLSTTGGSATPEADFLPVAQRLSFDRGTESGTERVIDIVILDDEIDEDDETFSVRLDGQVGASLATPHELTVTIEDGEDDDAGLLVLGGEPLRLVTVENGSADTFDLVLTTQPLADVTVPLISSDPSEGFPEPATLTFSPGDWDVPQTVTVTGVDDAEADGAVHYEIAVGPIASADPKYAALPDPAAVVPAINGDDEASECDDICIRFIAPSPAVVHEAESELEVGVEVVTEFGLPTPAPVSFDVSTENGSATSPEDYGEVSAALSVPALTPSGVRLTVRVPIFDDCLLELPTSAGCPAGAPIDGECFTVLLDNTVGAVLETPELPVFILDDERFFVDEDAWRAVAGTAQVFDTTRENVALADEVMGLPIDGAELGGELTFDSLNTQLATSFRVRTLQPDAKLVFNDPGDDDFRDALSIGKVGVHQNDDVEIEFTDGRAVRAFGFYIVENQFFPSEYLQLVSPGGLEVARIPGRPKIVPNTEEVTTFVGFVTGCPIGTVRFFEGGGGDHIAVRRFVFGAPTVVEIPTLSTTGLVAMVLLLLAAALGLLRGLLPGGAR